jgi:hypothetical protein
VYEIIFERISDKYNAPVDIVQVKQHFLRCVSSDIAIIHPVAGVDVISSLTFRHRAFSI